MTQSLPWTLLFSALALAQGIRAYAQHADASAAASPHVVDSVAMANEPLGQSGVSRLAQGAPAATAPATSGNAALAAFAAKLPHPVRLGVSTMDSGLRDCHIPFDELRTKALSCTKGPPVAGRSCEAVSPSQFPEVVSIAKLMPADAPPMRFCSGALIALNWVLTGAHCILGGQKATKAGGVPDTDFVLQPTDLIVSSDFALSLEAPDRIQSVRRAIVYRGYGGQGSEPPYFLNDTALLELIAPFPDSAVRPAVLAPTDTFEPATTLAGYGFSNADNGSFGRLNFTWPMPMNPDSGKFSFRPDDGRAFCQGDSGGPVFAGRYRGCRSDDIAGEPRPRLIQGTISYDFPGFADSTSGVSRELLQAEKCMDASVMAVQSITAPELRNWICTTTRGQAGGC
jgi:Trypsin